ncbi:MAG: hypothetical protein ACKV1O_05670 [Saprospiraceae bacterium]
MTILSRHTPNEITYLLKVNYRGVYSRLQEVLTAEELSLFAIPERKTSEQFWYVEGNYSIRSYIVINEEEKDWVSVRLEELKETILPKLQADKELASAAEDLFQIPSEEAILVIEDTAGNMLPILIQWGCRSSGRDKNNNPLEKVINRPKPDHSRVWVNVRYSNGAVFAGLPVFFEYKGRQKALRTNKEGKLFLGLIKNNLPFSIGMSQDATAAHTHQFSVIPNHEAPYEVVFPYFIKFDIKVIDQDEAPVSNAQIQTVYDNTTGIYVTNEDGISPVLQVALSPAPFIVEEVAQPENHQSFALNQETERLIFLVKYQQYAQVSVIVEDEEGRRMADYPVTVKHTGETRYYQSDKAGMINLGDIAIEERVTIIDGKDNNNNKETGLSKGEQEIMLQVKRPVPAMIRVNLIDHKNNPMPGIPMDFAIGGQAYHKLTNELGYCEFGEELFTTGEKVKVAVNTKTKRGKNKIHKKAFTYTGGQTEYTIKLRKINWWWLLLLLLPLLLIKCEKEVYVQVIGAEPNQVVANTDVHFSYHKYFLFDEGQFFVKEFVQRLEKTDTFGIAKFSGLKYSVYSMIFKFYTPALVFTDNGCFGADTLSPLFHRIWNGDTLKLVVTPILIPLDFRVIDEEDKEPLPDAMVSIRSTYLGKEYIDSSRTDANGRVVFDQVPRCGNVTIARGSAEGYASDEITNVNAVDLIGDIDQKRLLKLKPIKEKLVFFVEDCKTSRRIPGALVTIEIDFGGRKSTQKKRTNVNGVGKGEYDDAHIIADVTLVGESPPYYKKATLPTYKVGDFIKLPDSLRTICLEPIPNTVLFKNIDSLSRQPIAGVRNIVTIENGGVVTTDTVMGNGKGEFVFVINPGDQVSVVSKYPPDYEDNTTKIKKADGIKLKDGPASERIVPLKPKMTELTFRTVESSNPSVTIPNADIKVQLMAGTIPLSLPTPSKSDGNGSFVVKAPVNSTISIEASKAGYGVNTTKVRNEQVKALQQAPQIQRDIPLEQVPPTPPPCNDVMASGEDGITINEHDMQNPNMQFTIRYNMNNVPDQMLVYCGGENDQTIVLNRTPGKVSGSGALEIDLRNCNSSLITVKIIGGAQTDWDYTIICPN